MTTGPRSPICWPASCPAAPGPTGSGRRSGPAVRPGSSRTRRTGWRRRRTTGPDEVGAGRLPPKQETARPCPRRRRRRRQEEMTPITDWLRSRGAGRAGAARAAGRGAGPVARGAGTTGTTEAVGAAMAATAPGPAEAAEAAGAAGGGLAVDEVLDAGLGLGQHLVGLGLGVLARGHLGVEVGLELGHQGVDDLRRVDALGLGHVGQALTALEGAAELVGRHAERLG